MEPHPQTTPCILHGFVRLASGECPACASEFQPRSFELGDRVVAGKLPSDRDTGTVLEVRGDQVYVSWDSGVRTWQPNSLLEVPS